MKKIPKPFTIEVKRSRLPTRQQSTFQRYAFPALTETKPGSMLPQVQTPLQNPVPPPPSQPRVLPDLSAGKVWIEEPRVAQAAATEPVTVCSASEEQAVETLPAPHAEVISGDVDLGMSSPEEPHAPPKPRKRLSGTAADLPRGQRWKRRLPRSAW
jgi:hypothetical protein